MKLVVCACCVCVAYIGTGQVMGWGHKAIEIRSVDTGELDGVFMHKKPQKLKFLCERNDKVCAVVIIIAMIINNNSNNTTICNLYTIISFAALNFLMALT